MAQHDRNAHTAADLVSGLDLLALKHLFNVAFTAEESGGVSPRFFFAPGWVDLMGCPTLNVGGWSLSMPVDRGVVVAAHPCVERRLRVQMLMNGETGLLELDALPPTSSDHWMSVLSRVVQSLQMRNVHLTGADLLISSNLPPGLGLKNLQALEEAVTLALYCLSGSDVFQANGLAMAGHAWLKNHDTQEVWPVNLGFPQLSLVLCDSRIQPGLMSALGPNRLSESRYGLDLLRMVHPEKQALDEWTVEALDTDCCGLEDEIIRKRVRHCIGENARVLPAAEALKAGDMNRLAALLAESAESWRLNFELSCPEWDTLAALPRNLAGVMGTRVLTGGDFEGCTLNWLYPAAMAKFEAQILDAYETVFDSSPYISVVQPGAIAQELLLPRPALV